MLPDPGDTRMGGNSPRDDSPARGVSSVAELSSVAKVFTWVVNAAVPGFRWAVQVEWCRIMDSTASECCLFGRLTAVR